MFLDTYNTEFDDMIIRFTDQNGRPLETEDKVNLKLLINKQTLHVILQNKEQENMSKDQDFYHSQKIYPINTGKKYWIPLQKQDQMVAKTVFKNVVHKTVKATSALIGNKIAGKI